MRGGWCNGPSLENSQTENCLCIQIPTYPQQWYRHPAASAHSQRKTRLLTTHFMAQLKLLVFAWSLWQRNYEAGIKPFIHFFTAILVAINLGLPLLHSGRWGAQVTQKQTQSSAHLCSNLLFPKPRFYICTFWSPEDQVSVATTGSLCVCEVAYRMPKQLVTAQCRWTKPTRLSDLLSRCAPNSFISNFADFSEFV